jgi:hypothetical protein
MKFLRNSVAAMLLCLAFACNSASTNEESVQQLAQTDQKQEVEKQQAPQPPNGNKQTFENWDKKIIKNAQLNLEVEDYNSYNQLVHTNVKNWGGYIAHEEEQSTEYQKVNTLSLKVPVDQFDNVVQSLSSGKEKVIVKKISSEDVTGEVVDTRSRMETKRQTRQRYLDLLKQAKNMEEILLVQNRIDDIQLQIESATGRLDYLTHASALSTIQLTFFQVIKPGAPETKDPSFGYKVLDSLKNGLVWVGELFLLILNLWPLALLGVFIYWGFKKWRSARLKTGS